MLVSVRSASNIGERCFFGSNSRPLWHVDLAEVNASRGPQEPSMSTSTPHSPTSGARPPQGFPCLPGGLAKQFHEFLCKPGGPLIDDELVEAPAGKTLRRTTPEEPGTAK
jgi:hypothetical protein